MVFFVGSKKKKRADDRHTKTHERCCLFGVPTTFAKKAKKGEKRRKRISLSRDTFLISVVIVVVVDSFFLSAFERERRTERERERKERVFLSRPFFSQSFQVRSCKVIK